MTSQQAEILSDFIIGNRLVTCLCIGLQRRQTLSIFGRCLREKVMASISIVHKGTNSDLRLLQGCLNDFHNIYPGMVTIRDAPHREALSALLDSRAEAFDLCWLEDDEWSSLLLSAAAAFHLVKAGGWLCFSWSHFEYPQPDDSVSFDKFNAIEELMEKTGNIGTIRRVGRLLLVQIGFRSVTSDEVALGRIIYRAQYDPDYRFRILGGLTLPPNSTPLRTDPLSLGLTFVDACEPLLLGSEVLLEQQICRLPRPVWDASSTRKILMDSLEQAVNQVFGRGVSLEQS